MTNKPYDGIIAALIGVIATGASIYIIWMAAFIMKAIGDMMR